MNIRTYPYRAWTVTRSGKPVVVEICAKGSLYPHYAKDARGKMYDPCKLHATRTLAVIAALEVLDAKEESLKRQMARLEKKRAALEKARTEA